jgi:hypothetical protein
MLPWANAEALHPDSTMTTTDQPIAIPADQRLVRTPLAVDPSQPLRLAAEGTWCDTRAFCVDADGVMRPNWFQRLGARFKRVPEARYMALIGCIDGDLDTAFVIGTGIDAWTPPRAGTLCCFANDVPGFYWNNSGFVTLIVTFP